MAESLGVVLTDQTEDWPKRTWDFPRDDGSSMDTIDEVAGALCLSHFDAARMVVTYPFPSAVPVKLLQESIRVLRQ